MAPILFIHNRAISYRLPLFSLLKEHYGDQLDFVFYHEPAQKKFAATYLPFASIFGYKFSIQSITTILKRKPSILILSGSHSYELLFQYMAARMVKAKIVYWTEQWSWGKMNLKNKIFITLHAWIAKKSDAIIYPGKKTNEWYKSLHIPANRMFFAPNSSHRLISKKRAQNKKVQVIQISRFMPRKGIDYFIRAAQYLPAHFECTVAGHGDKKYQAELQALIDASPADIRLVTGISTSDQVSSLLQNSDILVYPSVNINGMGEPWGLLINEAVYLKKPIVTTSVVAAAFDLVIDNKNGMIIHTPTPKSIAAAITEAAKIPQHTISETSKKLSDLYSYPTMAKGFISAITYVQK